ncbi:GAP1-N1 domain-containing protein [Bradyrhizobium diazoefficiens]
MRCRESGHYALARTWPAPELPRPGCVWTHTILIDFSDIPSLSGAGGILKLFRRPQGDERSYGVGIAHVSLTEDDGSDISDDFARRILSAVYGDPARPIVSAAADVPTRDALVLAIWNQQWPRLRRAFRFCTLSFADRSSANATFDLQFLPSAGRVRPTQFKSAVDADRRDFVATEWLEDTVADLKEGANGGLRRFLRLAGSDLGGRESFEPLAALHVLSLHFDSDPTAIERAISLLEGTISTGQGHAARLAIVQAAAAAADRLGPDGLQFVVRNFGLIDPAESDAAAERVGCALWRVDPKALFDIRSDPARGVIAERAIVKMPPASLLEGIASTPAHLAELLGARPDLATEPGLWLLEGATKPDLFQIIENSPGVVDGAIDAMIRSGRPLSREARATFGSDRVLRRLLARFGDPTIDDGIRSLWLSTVASDVDAVARILVEDWVDDVETLEAIAHFVAPDAVPNAYGDDPWLVAIRRLSAPLGNAYLASFLLVRALGRRTMNSVELVQSTFDVVYDAAEQRTLPEDAWRILDRRLDRSYWWHDWDKCVRLRHTVVNMYLDRGIDALAFVAITARDDVFFELIAALSEKFGSQRYLKAIRNRMVDAGMGGERLRIVKHAIIW